MTSDPHQLAPDHLPTPFTAEEIRLGCPPGRTLRYAHERGGQPTVIRVTRYVTGDADGCVQESWQESAEGTRLNAPERSSSTWRELQQHASFEAATTTRDEDEIDLPAGSFQCLRYTRVDNRGTWRFWFARNLPGSPVRFEQEVANEIVFKATLLENKQSWA